jgi:hypothetical protein
LGKLLEAADRMDASGKPRQDKQLTKDELMDFLKNFGASLPPNDAKRLEAFASMVFAQNPGPLGIQAIVDGMANMIDAKQLRQMA